MDFLYKKGLTSAEKLTQNKKNLIANMQAGIPFEQSKKTYGAFLPLSFIEQTYGKKDKISWGQINPMTKKTPEQGFLEMGVSQELINAAKTAGINPDEL